MKMVNPASLQISAKSLAKATEFSIKAKALI